MIVFLRLRFILLTLLDIFFQIKVAQCDTCLYYPNYPLLTPSFTTSCSDSYTCCDTVASTQSDTCCMMSTSISNSFWWITLAIIGCIFLVICGTLIGKLICYKKNKHLRIVGAASSLSNTNSLFRISNNHMPNYGYNPNDNQLPSYNLLPQSHILFERVNSEPPKYDEFIKYQQQNADSI